MEQWFRQLWLGVRLAKEVIHSPSAVAVKDFGRREAPELVA